MVMPGKTSLYRERAALQIARMEMAERIAIRRKAVGLSQSQLGKAVGVTGSAVSQWERGLDSPRPDKLERLARALEVDVGWLLTGQNGAPLGRRDQAPPESDDPELEMATQLMEILAAADIPSDTRSKLFKAVVSFARKARAGNK